jgi:predicted ferric reductase
VTRTSISSRTTEAWARPDETGTATDTRARSSEAGQVDPYSALTAIGLGALLCVAWPLFQALQGPQPLQLPVVVAHTAGMLAGYGVVVLVALMSRLPALERGVGADRLARWHSRGGRIVVALVLAHAWGALQAWEDSRGEFLGLALWHVLRLPWLIAATVGTVLMLLVAGMSVRAARRRVSFETWHTMHLLVYVAVALGFVHQLAGPDFAGHRLLQVAWALLYTGTFALVVQYRVLTPLRDATRHRMRVKAVVPETPGVVSIVIEGRDLHELQAESGQFFRWRFLTPDYWKTAHPFSLSAPPKPDELRLTVKTLGDGSARLQHLEPGTWVVAEGPYGAVTAQRRTRRNVLLIAGGVGITPMRALFETMPLSPDQDLLLLYRVRSESEAIFKAELDEIAANCSGARIQYLYGDAGPLTPQLFLRHAPDLLDRDVYLCGPPGLAAAVRRSLRRAGLPDSQLHEERFDL